MGTDSSLNEKAPLDATLILTAWENLSQAI
jgi:hypothetical protein